MYNRTMDYNNPNLPLSEYSFDRENKGNSQTERPTAMALREAFEDVQTARLANAAPTITDNTAGC